MKHPFGLLYFAVGIAVGLIIGASVTGLAAGNDEKAVETNAPGRYQIEAVRTAETGAQVFVLDTQTGTVHQRRTWNSSDWSKPWQPIKPGDE